MSKLVELKTSKDGGLKQAFNPRYIVKLAPRDKDNFTFMDLVDYGDRNAILSYTVYEPYDQVVKKISEAMNG